jgi:NAD(P)-dependent dehydrogenase (short-subunit alcohol dehydrogenase family)
MQPVMDRFRLDGKVVVITGGAGFLGLQYAGGILEAGGIPVLLDINPDSLADACNKLEKDHSCQVMGIVTDITSKSSIQEAFSRIIDRYHSVHVLINNAAYDPKVSANGATFHESRFEHFSEEQWDKEAAIGLKGAVFCSQVFGTFMAGQKSGVILNISSDLGLIAPDQRLYRVDGLPDSEQPVKPVTYSVIKHGIIGLTRYLATYWADKGIRVNAICPGGVFHNQSEGFVLKVSELIPLGRMAEPGEYIAAILFLISDASSYMTGSVLTMDGGRTCW